MPNTEVIDNEIVTEVDDTRIVSRPQVSTEIFDPLRRSPKDAPPPPSTPPKGQPPSTATAPSKASPTDTPQAKPKVASSRVWWFQLPPTEFLADTRFMSDRERGWYVYLLCEYFNRRGVLPDDVVKLAVLAGASDVEAFATWYSKTAPELITRAMEKLEEAATRSENGRKAAKDRWGK
jgi:hypothetical protein